MNKIITVEDAANVVSPDTGTAYEEADVIPKEQIAATLPRKDTETEITGPIPTLDNGRNYDSDDEHPVTGDARFTKQTLTTGSITHDWSRFTNESILYEYVH